MRDYEKQAADLRLCAESDDPVDECCWEECTAHQGDRSPMCRQKTMLDAADAIEELLAAVPKWISVEERLPEKHVEVLICTEDYGKNELGFANTAVWDGSEWIETWNRKESIPYVSHWMPLPAPPKEANHENP